MKVLFVCHGNVNRSAAAEIIAKQDFPQIEVKSCGLKTTNGKITAKKMRDVLVDEGYPTEGIRSTVISKELVEWADYIFYMDDANEKRFIEQFGELSHASKLSNQISGVNKIPDPAFAEGTDMHHQVVKLIKQALANWLAPDV
jgi:protein-tyrosine-phosphatase